jgi:hypothetical protein
MTPEDQALHDEAHNAFVAITLRTGKRSFNQQKRTIEAWLNKYVPQAEARGLTEGVVAMRRNGVLAMRRNAIDWLITEAAEAKRPAHAFEPLLHDMEALGWESLEQKARKTCVICSYFARRMWKRLGLRYLVPVRNEVTRECARTGDKNLAVYLRWLDEIEQNLRARGRPF